MNTYTPKFSVMVNSNTLEIYLLKSVGLGIQKEWEVGKKKIRREKRTGMRKGRDRRGRK